MSFFIILQQEPPFNGQTNNFAGGGYQYNQGNMNGVSPSRSHQLVACPHLLAVTNSILLI